MTVDAIRMHRHTERASFYLKRTHPMHLFDLEIIITPTSSWSRKKIVSLSHKDKLLEKQKLFIYTRCFEIRKLKYYSKKVFEI